MGRVRPNDSMLPEKQSTSDTSSAGIARMKETWFHQNVVSDMHVFRGRGTTWDHHPANRALPMNCTQGKGR
jgi:hypothetical protein